MVSGSAQIGELLARRRRRRRRQYPKGPKKFKIEEHCYFPRLDISQNANRVPTKKQGSATQPLEPPAARPPAARISKILETSISSISRIAQNIRLQFSNMSRIPGIIGTSWSNISKNLGIMETSWYNNINFKT